MRMILIALSVWLAALGAVPAQESAPGPAPDPAQAVIRAQIDAFMDDDFVTAFTFASPNIRRVFGSPQIFAQMVVTGYPMVHRPADLRFAGQAMRGETLVQRVLITDDAGALHVLEYDLIDVDGTPLIDAVRILRAGQAGV